jgi:hypothetical protein
VTPGKRFAKPQLRVPTVVKQVSQGFQMALCIIQV